MSKLFDAVAVLSLSLLLSSGGMAGYLYFNGRLTSERIEQIAAILRGETLGAPVPASQPAASQPTSQPAAEESHAPTADELHAARRHEYLESLRLERARRDLEAQQRLVQHALQKLISEQEAFSQSKEEYESQRDAAQKTAQDEGFAKELEYVTGLSPKLAKEHILRSWQKEPADTVRLFLRIDAGRGKRILEQFKSPDELKVMHELLERVRTAGSR